MKKRFGIIEDNFSDLAEELLKKGPSLPQTIIYCRRLIDCGKIFQFFDLVLLDKQYWPSDAPQILENRLFHQYHKPLPRSNKECVLKLLSSSYPTCRIVISTVALGMGLNCQNISRVIHYGVPTTMEAYYQECGRCGRNGEQATATLLFNGHDIKQDPYPMVTTVMREYCLARTCLRRLILAHFGDKDVEQDSRWCCSVCSSVKAQ